MNNYFYNTYYNISKILFLLLPISLISGPFLPDLTAVLMSILVIFFIKNKKTDYLKNYFIIFSVIFYIYIVIVSINSQNLLLSLESSLFYIIYFICSLHRIFLDDDDNIIKYFFMY